MTKFRLAATTAMASFALLLVGGAGTAAAQDGALAFGKKVPMTGETKSGRQFAGTFAIKKFVQREGQAFAVGTVRGTFKNRSIVRRGVAVPASLASGAQAAAAQQPPPVELPIPTPGACTILDLVLGPIDLNLLGPRVATNEIRLLIEAVPGANNLLGNLLCAITNLLNPPVLDNTPLGQLVRILNALLALAPRTAAPA
jgi:hypothetical protein